MEIEKEDERSNGSFQGELDLVYEEEEENQVSQKERLNKILDKIKQQNEVSQDNNQEQSAQVLRAGNQNVLRAGAQKKNAQNEKNTIPEPFVPNFKLNERYFFQNMNVNEWSEITNFIEKFISDEKLGEKDLESFFESHPKIAKGNISKLQSTVADIFSKKKDIKKYKILTNYLIKKYYKPKPVICECYFFPNPSNEQRVVNMFRTCKKTLDVAIFTFTRDSIAQAILEAKQRGVKVRCIGDDGNSKVKGSDVRLLASVGIPCKTDNNLRFHMHNKMAIIDNSVVITGSFNWTNQAINKNQDNILFIEDKDIANQYTEYYNKIWDSFSTVITPEDAKKYMEEEEKKAQKNQTNDKKETTAKKETAKKEATTKKETTKKEATAKKETTKKETAKKETAKKETTKKETTKKETNTKKETTKKEKAKKETTAKKGTAKKETVKKETTKKETAKKETVKKEKSSSKEKTTKEKGTSSKAKSSSKEKEDKKEKSISEKTTKKEKENETKEKRPKTMKETKKSSTVKSNTNKSTKEKAKTTKEKPKTTKEKKKEKVEKSKPKTEKRVRGVKSTTKSSKKAKK